MGDLLRVADSCVSEDDWLALVRSTGAGDVLALRRLYERAHQPVFTLLIRMTRRREIAEQLTLETFHYVWRQASSYQDSEGSVLGWIMSLARARALECPPGLGASQEIAGQRRFLRVVFSVLTFAERQAIEATFFAGRTYEEAAASLREPPAVVKMRLRVALQKVRRVLAESPGTE